MSIVLMYRDTRYCLSAVRNKGGSGPLIKVAADEVLTAAPVYFSETLSEPHPKHPVVVSYDGKYVILTYISPKLKQLIADGGTFEARLISNVALKTAKL